MAGKAPAFAGSLTNAWRAKGGVVSTSETVSVEVNTVLPTSDRSYEVDWTETTRDLQGVVTATARLKGSFTIAVDPPSDEATARMNPLGIYVTNASWSRVL